MSVGDRRIRRQMLRLWKQPDQHETIPPAVYRELIDAATRASTHLQVLRRNSVDSPEELAALDEDLDTLIRIIKRYRPSH